MTDSSFNYFSYISEFSLIWQMALKTLTSVAVEQRSDTNIQVEVKQKCSVVAILHKYFFFTIIAEFIHDWPRIWMFYPRCTKHSKASASTHYWWCMKQNIKLWNSHSLFVHKDLYFCTFINWPYIFYCRCSSFVLMSQPTAHPSRGHASTISH